MIALGVGVRCYSLCVSFHYVNGSRTIFGPYFLIPIALAVGLVWLEIGIAARRRSVMLAASLTPVLLVYLATTGHRYEPVYMTFLGTFRHTLGGTPFYETTVFSVLFLAYAVLRRAPAGWDLLSAALVVLAAVGPRSLDWSELVPLRPLPLAAAGIVLGIEGWRQSHSFRAFLAGILLAIAGTRSSVSIWPSADWAVTALQLLIVSWMAVGALFNDWMGRFSRSCACAGLLAMGTATGLRYPLIVNSLPAAAVPWYPPVIAILSFAFGRRFHDLRYFASAAAAAAAWSGHSGMQSYQQLRRAVVGLDQIAYGLLFFVVATSISLNKAGIWPRSLSRWVVRSLRRSSPASPPTDPSYIPVRSKWRPILKPTRFDERLATRGRIG